MAVIALAAINYRGITRTARLSRAIVTVVLLALALAVVTALVGGSPEPDRVVPRLDAGGWYGVLQSAGPLFFAFAGYARIATLGEEVRDPARSIPAPSRSPSASRPPGHRWRPPSTLAPGTGPSPWCASAQPPRHSAPCSR